MATSQEKLLRVQELLKKRQYEAAMKILQTMPEDPQAKQVIPKVDAAARLEKAKVLRGQKRYSDARRILAPVTQFEPVQAFLDTLPPLQEMDSTSLPRRDTAQPISRNSRNGPTLSKRLKTINYRLLDFVQSIPPFAFSILMTVSLTALTAIFMARAIAPNGNGFGSIEIERLFNLSLTIGIVTYMIIFIWYQIRSRVGYGNTEPFYIRVASRLASGLYFAAIVFVLCLFNVINGSSVLDSVISFPIVITVSGLLFGIFFRELLPIIGLGSVVALVAAIMGVL